MLEIAVLPSGHLRCRLSADGGENENYNLQRVAAVFGKTGEGAGLVALAALRNLDGLSMGAMFWRDFAVRFLRTFAEWGNGGLSAAAANTADAGAGDTADDCTPPPPAPETVKILLAIPPMPGAEYLTVSALDGRWLALDAWVREECAALGGTAPFFLRYAPQYRASGQVSLHLAERREESQPFALIASYAAGLDKYGATARVKLTAAFAEQCPAALAPLHAAAAVSPFLASLLKGGRLFAPVPLTADAAYNFLKETPLYERAGIAVQVPDWWHERPQAAVQITIGNTSHKKFTGEGLLDFNVAVAAGGRELTPAEVRELLSAGSGLRLVYGRWVEIDGPRLEQALQHWQSLKEQTGEGLSFAAGMRLLAGAEIGSDELAAGENLPGCSRSAVTAGEYLRHILERIRPPGSAANPDSAVKPLKFGTRLQAELRPYQAAGVRWLSLLSRLGLGACLADDMGLGKTLQIIALLVLIKKRRQRRERLRAENFISAAAAAKLRPPVRPSLIVVPASLIANWQAELHKFAPWLQCRILHPAFSRTPLAEIPAQGEKFFAGVDVAVTTYAQLVRSSWIYLRRWHLCVLDEAQAIKNPHARQSRIVKRIRSRSRIALTGTPMENRLGDLWSLFDFLNPGLLGSAAEFQSWTHKLSGKHNAGTAENVSGFAPLRRLIRPYILRRLKTDRTVIADLPDKSEVDAFCRLSPLQAALYRENVASLETALEHTDGLARRGLVLAYLMRFKQICNHPALFRGESFFAPEDSGKFLRLREIAEVIASRQEKALVFTQFRKMTAPLAAFLRTIFGETGAVLHGDTPPAERGRLTAEFQREDGPPFFVLSLKAGGTGLNLTAAAHVIHFDRWWNPAVERQATDRAYRIGQHQNVLVHKFICEGTLEEKINELLREKAEIADALLGGGETLPALTEMSNDELLRLVTLRLDNYDSGS